MKVEKTKKDFEDYITNLSFEEKCKYMGELFGVVNLCNNPLFKCKFRKKDIYKNRGDPKEECTRQDIARIKKILG